MLVVKVGGSLYNTIELKKWLACLKNYSSSQAILIVPGGGPFADQVRTAQNIHHFGDKQAHHMAILAMAQFALLIEGIESQCQLFHYPDDKIPSSPFSVWLPDEKLLAINEIAQNWSVTSDSLALWLAQQLQADELIIIKCVQDMSNSIATLVNKHIIDSAFETQYHSAPLKTRLVHFQDHVNFKPHSNSGIVIS